MSVNGEPRASIIIPAYNAEKYILDTLNSIVAQNFTDWECLVVDDGSDDDTASLVEAYPDQRVRLIRQENSGGPSKPRNKGIEQSRAAIIFMFDADDLMMPSKLSITLTQFDKHPSIGFFFTDFSEFSNANDNGKSFVNAYKCYKNLVNGMSSISNFYTFDSLPFIASIVAENFVGASSVAFRRSLLDSNQKLFCEDVSSGDDLLAWITLAENSNVGFIDKILHKYRVREDSISNTRFERLATTKIRILSLIEQRFKNQPKILKAASKKSGEYYLALGYYYRKSYRFDSSREAYCSAFRCGEIRRAFLGSIKLVVDYLVQRAKI